MDTCASMDTDRSVDFKFMELQIEDTPEDTLDLDAVDTLEYLELELEPPDNDEKDFIVATNNPEEDWDDNIKIKVEVNSSDGNDSLLKCLVCSKALPRPVVKRGRKPKEALPHELLLALSKMFSISPTIYETINMSTVHNPLYCKSCIATIFSALQILTDIKILESKLASIRQEVKSSLIDSYNNCELSEKGHFETCNNPVTVVARIRRSYVQCWTPCKVNLPELVGLKTEQRSPILTNKSHLQASDEVDGINRQQIQDCSNIFNSYNSFDGAQSKSTLLKPRVNRRKKLVLVPEADQQKLEIKENTIQDFGIDDIGSEPQQPDDCGPSDRQYSPLASPGSPAAVITTESPDSDSDFDLKVKSRSKKRKRRLLPGKKGANYGPVSQDSRKGILLQRKATNRQKPYHCNICGKSYAGKYYFKVHQKYHTGDLNFPCPSCSESFKNISRLRQHRLIHHRETITDSSNIKKLQRESEDALSTYDSSGQLLAFQCKYCNQEFRKKEHVSSSGEFNIQCPSLCCGKTFVRFVRFACHHQRACLAKPSEPKEDEDAPKTVAPVNKVTPRRKRNSNKFPRKDLEKVSGEGVYDRGILRNSPYRERKFANRVMPFICPICEKGYSVKHYFDIHLRCHAGPVNFPCPACPQSFTTPSKLRQHRLIRHRDIYSNSKNIKKRQKESDDAQCKYDSAGQLLAFHCKHCNLELEKKDYTSPTTGEFKIKCPDVTCGKTFTKFTCFSLHHQKTCTSRPPQLGDIFQCEHCGQRFSTGRNLQNHIVCQHTKQFGFYCEVCGAGFVFESFLKQHMVCHSDVKTFKCEYCPQLFKRKKQLTIHTRMHTNEAPYMCQTCGKRFTSNNKVRNHEAIHSEVKPFNCPICNKSFVSKRYVRNHVWATHEKARKRTSKPEPKATV